VRSVDGLPFSYLTTHVPESVSLTFSRQDLATRPLRELLERAGVKVEHARQRISAGLATPEVAEALGLHTGSPLIELVRVVFDQSGHGVEHLHALYRPDRYAFEIDLVRSGAADTKAWAPVIHQRSRRPHSESKLKNLKPKDQAGGIRTATLTSRESHNVGPEKIS
jgi:GntR family transcriptional regulator